MAKKKRTPTPADESAPRNTTQAELWLPAEIDAILTWDGFPKLDDDKFAMLGVWLRENSPHRPPPPRSLAELAREASDTSANAERDHRAKVEQRLREIHRYNVNRRAQAAPAKAGERMESSKLPASRRRSGVDAIKTDQGQKRRREKPGRRQRRSLPPEDEAKVLERCRRRCCVCFVLEKNDSQQDGQLAHLDHTHSNGDPTNFVFLCLRHHNIYDSKMTQAKNMTEREVRLYQQKLHQAVEQDEVPRRR